MSKKDLLVIRDFVQSELSKTNDALSHNPVDPDCGEHQDIGYKAACLTILSFIDCYIGPDFTIGGQS